MIAVDDEWYDLEKWAKYHPGGTFIAVFSHVCFFGSKRALGVTEHRLNWGWAKWLFVLFLRYHRNQIVSTFNALLG
jgi:hypothetical protein